MRFKELPVHEHWLPRNKPAYRLWQSDAEGRPMIPSGVPNPVPFRRLWGDEDPSSTGNADKAREKVTKALDKRSFIKSGLQGYIKFWEYGMRESLDFRKDFPPYIDYWNGILAELEKPLPPTPSALVKGFWPIQDWGSRDPAPLCLITCADVTPEDDEPEPYCGSRRERPKDASNPWRDVGSGSWVLLRPSDPEIYPVWLGRACSGVNCERGHADYGKFILQFWEPRNSFKNHKKKYEDCWSATWVPEKRRPLQVHVNSVVFASLSSRTNPQTWTIPKRDKFAALANLEAANAADP